MELLAHHLGDCSSGWSMGTFGAIAEFTRDPDEDATPGEMCVVTPRGGVLLQPQPGLRLIASESLTRDAWSQRVALCLPQQDCAMNRRSVLTELGPDQDALRAEDRDGVLFDLGLNCLQIDACVRITDAAALGALRRAAGRPVFAPDSPALPILMQANPHRVFASRLGRLEVFQPIPPPGGRSPDGPHTHILPKLLAADRTHAATEPLPDGWIPCAHLYPAHPLRDGEGRPQPFRRDHHDAFQALLARYGATHLVGIKRAIEAAVAAGHSPSSLTPIDGRDARAAARIAVRQLRSSGTAAAVLPEWLAAFDGRGGEEIIDPMEQLH